MRKQNITLIRHLQFDSVIIGNSFTENTSAKEAGDVFGGNFINISMSGSVLHEQSFVLDYVLRHKKIKTVFGILSERTNRRGHGSYPLSEWTFLYDDNRFNDFKVYLNKQSLKCLSEWSISPKCVGKQVDMDRPSAWLTMPGYVSRFGGLDNWIMHHETAQLKDTLHKKLPQYADKPLTHLYEDMPAKTASSIRDTIDEFIVMPAKKYHDTNFFYFFNPHLLLDRAFAARDSTLNIHAFWVKETVLRCAALNNVQIFLFDNEIFTEEISNYKDLGHYSSDINSLILQSVRLRKNLLTPDNVDEQLSLLRERAAAYDIKTVNSYVQEELRRIATGTASQN
ncbi:MAG: hypothetical protein LBK03_02145 [Bacteroidales bacterium]|jgi:hypothetical protein|nr:hypothetical protein [Bacteroidales bacterium]